MSVPAIVWIVVGLITLACLTILAVRLLRALKGLGGAVQGLRLEVLPLVEGIRQDADRARSAALNLSRDAGHSPEGER